ncbi:uroporphyrinogen-III synthase [Marininema halotolerans]|uniref:Uroporphyrinogen-III synthase n=1 Tax=Marininema halotolerans TaxID=1155944 RepID=A0A1I6UCT7_9BACL|nr:uroporphyrinogen-III synthase [Marininema halotolerans]SFS99243.1 uroporphyrinogen III methyltransferase / synthase [Marininema halotolerans]
MIGRVTFIGAGPKALDHLTLRGREALLDAEVILTDESLDIPLLEGLSVELVKVPLGKPGEHMLVEWAQHGKSIARVVVGDARLTGEMVREAEALFQAKIPFTIIPGVSEQVAWTTYAGLALPSFDEWSIGTDGQACILRLQQSVSQTAKELITRGWAPQSVGSLITSGMEMNQQVRAQSLQAWETDPMDCEEQEASFFVVNHPAHTRLPWFESKPLFGTRVLITRQVSQGKGLAHQIEALGGEAITIPTIRLAPPQNAEVLDDALSRLSSFTWVIFTSVNGVDFFLQRLRQQQVDIRGMHQAKIAAVGPKTAEALRKLGLTVDVIAKEYRGEGLIQSLAPLVKSGEEILLPRATIASEVLPEELRRLGCRVTDAPTYDTLPDESGTERIAAMLQEKRLDIITFTSASTVRYFTQSMDQQGDRWRSHLSGVKVACIGPVTAKEAEKCRLSVDWIAQPYTIDALLEGVTRLVHTEGFLRR